MTPSDAAERDPDLSAPADDGWRDASDVGTEESRAAWAVAAREVLMEAAGRYQHVVTYKELAAQVQERTRIGTSQLMTYWIGDVLGRVTVDCAERGEPLLSALCVNAQGSVGTGYAASVAALGRPMPEDPDDHAAHERLAAYRHVDAAHLPEGGGLPELVPKLAEARSRARKATFAARVVPTCPRCHLELAATGSCDNCD